MDSKLIREGMEACRPNMADLEMPEMAAVRERLQSDPAARQVHDRVQRLDARIRVAMHDVPVPQGLKQRLLEGIRAAAVSAIETDDDASIRAAIGCGAESNGMIEPAQRVASRWTRRRWLQAGAAVAASTLIGVCLVRYFRPAPIEPISKQNLADRVALWHEEVVDEAGWQPMTTAPLDFPLRRVRVYPSGWRDASKLIGEEAVAYDMTLPNGPRATLFVVHRRLPDVGSLPPAHPEAATQGRMLAYWQTPGLLYILVVDDQDERNYRKLVDTSLPQVA